MKITEVQQSPLFENPWKWLQLQRISKFHLTSTTKVMNTQGTCKCAFFEMFYNTSIVYVLETFQSHSKNKTSYLILHGEINNSHTNLSTPKRFITSQSGNSVIVFLYLGLYIILTIPWLCFTFFHERANSLALYSENLVVSLPWASRLHLLVASLTLTLYFAFEFLLPQASHFALTKLFEKIKCVSIDSK